MSTLLSIIFNVHLDNVSHQESYVNKHWDWDLLLSEINEDQCHIALRSMHRLWCLVGSLRIVSLALWSSVPVEL